MIRASRLLALAVAFGWGAAAAAANLTAMSATQVGGDVSIVLAIDGPFEQPSLFAMDGPPRIVVDLPGVSALGRSEGGAGTVQKLRSAQNSLEKARVVIDLASPMSLKSASSSAGTLTILLKPSDSVAFVSSVKRGRTSLPGVVALANPAAPLASVAAALEPAPVKPVVPTPAKPAAPKPAVKEPPLPVASPDTIKPMTRLVTRNRDGKLLVVIDPGHGGHDVGALSVPEGKREKDVVLQIGRAIARELEASGKVRVLLTRGDDRFIPKEQRPVIARAAKASLFISIHADSAPGSGASGASIYTLSDVASDAVAARLAARENKSGIITGVDFGATPDVADILIDLAQRETMNASSVFAGMLQKEMQPEVPFKTEFHRFAGFAVLKAVDVPSVLLETGYLSSEDDTKRIFSEEGQKAIAKGVRQAVEAFLVRSR